MEAGFFYSASPIHATIFVMDTIPKLLVANGTKSPDAPAQLSKDAHGVFQPRSWQRLCVEVNTIAAALIDLGTKRGDRIGLISENRAEWLAIDLAVLTLGAVDVPRGNDATTDEIAYILSFSEVKIVFVENGAQLDKLVSVIDRIPTLETVILIDDQSTHSARVRRVSILSYDDSVERGQRYIEKYGTDDIDRARASGTSDDLATIIFTSGTTGEPKGVMLSHGSFLNQVEHVPDLINVGATDIWLCVLPVWHSFERIMQYVSLGCGSTLAYSKPVGKIMLEDFQKVRPTWMASVPRIWEAVRGGIYRNVKTQSAIKRGLFFFFVAVGGRYDQFVNLVRGRLPRFRKRVRAVDALIGLFPLIMLWPLKKLGDVLVFSKIRARLGGRFVAGISGGGALPAAVDQFFAAAGILLLEGYGLTETAPVLGVRAQNHPVPGTVGPVFPEMEIEIRDEEGHPLPPGVQGTVFARGPQLMTGYYKRPELTAEVIGTDGWLNTGDLGMLTWDNELKITGRAKDTVVLLGGENVEPAPIEERLRESPFIAQAMVVGQDRKYLGALLVPDFDALQSWAAEQEVTPSERDMLVTDPQVRDLYANEIKRLVGSHTGFKSFERVYRFAVLSDDFVVGEELSAKQEIKRHVIRAKHAGAIVEMFA